MANIRKTYLFKPNYKVPPGETIREVMDNMAITNEVMAQHLNLSPQILHRMFIGQQPIMPDTAAKLDTILGIPAKFWNNIQAQYDANQT